MVVQSYIFTFSSDTNPIVQNRYVGMALHIKCRDLNLTPRTAPLIPIKKPYKYADQTIGIMVLELDPDFKRKLYLQ